MNKIYGYVGQGKLGTLLGKVSNFFYLECDITSKASIARALEEFRNRYGEPDLIVNCAGLTSIDECEKDKKKAFTLNVSGLANLHNVFGSRVVCISSDHVFSGRYFTAPTEKTKPKPINYYGWSKFGAEQISEISGGKIIRLSRTVSTFDHNFIRYMSQLTHGLDASVPSFFWRNYLTRYQAVSGIKYFTTYFDSMPQIVNYGGESNVSMVTLFKELAKGLMLDPNKIIPRGYELDEETPRPHWGGFRIKLAKKLGFPMYTLSDVCDGVSQELNWLPSERVLKKHE